MNKNDADYAADKAVRGHLSAPLSALLPRTSPTRFFSEFEDEKLSQVKIEVNIFRMPGYGPDRAVHENPGFYGPRPILAVNRPPIPGQSENSRLPSQRSARKKKSLSSPSPGE